MWFFGFSCHCGKAHSSLKFMQFLSSRRISKAKSLEIKNRFGALLLPLPPSVAGGHGNKFAGSSPRSLTAMEFERMQFWCVCV
jgi:hypothetical protein